MKNVRASVGVAIFLVGVPASSYADIGLPMIAVFLPPMWIAFVPVVLVEAFVLKKTLTITRANGLRASFLGNLATTVAGVPLVWMILAVIEMLCCGAAKGLASTGARLYAVTAQAPWLIPYEKEFWWMIPVALGVLAVPCYATSVLFEGNINLKLIDRERRSIWKATAMANAWSYGLLALFMWPALKFEGIIMPAFVEHALEWIIGGVFAIAKLLNGK
jgi:hypothetical protein